MLEAPTPHVRMDVAFDLGALADAVVRAQSAALAAAAPLRSGLVSLLIGTTPFVSARLSCNATPTRGPTRQASNPKPDLRPRSATNARALFGTHHAEPARPSAAIGAF
jgi:hypothetical protein